MAVEGGWGLHGLDEEDCERKSKGRRGDDCKLMGGVGGWGGGEREKRDIGSSGLNRPISSSILLNEGDWKWKAVKV